MFDRKGTSTRIGDEALHPSAERGVELRLGAKAWVLPELDRPKFDFGHPAPALHLKLEEDGVIRVTAELDNRVVISARPDPDALKACPKGLQLELPWPAASRTEAEALLRSWAGRNYEPLALARKSFGLSRLPPERLLAWAAIAGPISSWVARHGNLCRLVVARWMASEQVDELPALLHAEPTPRAALAYLGLPREAWLLRVIGKLPRGDVALRPYTQLLADLARCAAEQNKRKQLCHLRALNTTAVALVARAEGRLRLTPTLFDELAGGSISDGLRSRLERDLDLLCALMPRTEPIGSDEELLEALEDLDRVLLRNKRNHGHRGGPRPPAFGLRFDAQRLLPQGFVQLRTRSAVWREGNTMGHCLGGWGLNHLGRARVVYAHAKEPVPATLALRIDAWGRPWRRELKGRFNKPVPNEMHQAVEDHLASVRKRASAGIRAGRERLREALRSTGVPDWLARLSTRDPLTSVHIDWEDPASAVDQLPMSEAWLRPLRSVVDMHLRDGHGFTLKSAVAPAAVHGRIGPDQVALADYVGPCRPTSGPVQLASDLVNYQVAEHQATPALRKIGFELLVGPEDWRQRYAVRPIDPATCTDADVYAALEQLRHVATPDLHRRPRILLALQDCVGLTGSFFHAFDGDHGIPRIYVIDVDRCSGLDPDVLQKLARLPDPRCSVSSLKGILDLPQVGKDELLAMVRSGIFCDMTVRAERVASFQEELQSVADSSYVSVWQYLDGGSRLQIRNEECVESMTEISAERLWALLHGFEKVELWDCDLPAGVWSTVADAPVKSLSVSFLRPPLASDLEAIAALPHLEDLRICVRPPR